MTPVWTIFPLCLLLVACDSGADNDRLAEAEAAQSDMQAADGKVECALAGGERFMRACSTDRISGPDREILIIHHPDGGFQRFEIVTDGRGVIAADGFDDTEIRLLDNDMIEVTSDDNRYRLPARVQPGSAATSPAAQ